MTRAQRAVADKARLRKLGKFVLPRLQAKEDADDARMRHLASIPRAKRTTEEQQELGDLMAIWIMRESGVVGNARSLYG